MYNLKYLKIFSSFGSEKYYLRFPESPDPFPDELRYLGWDSYPYKSLPTDFKATNLVELDLQGSELNYLWNGVQDLANLKALDLSFSKKLIQIPDLSPAVKLETLSLSYCKCLNNLPSSIGKLESLKSLDVSECIKINEFPELAVNIRYLDMSGTSIEKVPSSIERLFLLDVLDLSYCKRLNSLPTTISKLRSLLSLHLCDCPRLEYLPPEIISEHVADQFQIDGSGIGESPSSIENPGGFQTSLCLEQSCFSMLGNLPTLYSLKLNGSNVSEIPGWFFRSPLLWDLDLSETRIRTIPASFKSSKLESLRITDCKSLESLPELPPSLREVEASGCTSLRMVSNASIETHLLFEEYPRTYWSFYRQALWFIDCVKLDHKNILTEFQMRALRLNVLPGPKDQTIFEFVEEIDYPDLCIGVPGDEIPKWFNCQNDNGSSLSMKLPSQYCRGFASCLAVAPEVNGESTSYIRRSSFVLVCVINVQTHSGERRIEFESRITVRTLRTNHVLMWYSPRSQIDLFSAREISFDFRIEREKPDHSFAIYHPSYKLERCGVRMLQPQDVVEFGYHKW
ncbi:Leucine-rich repeat [Trema orientale]|uniref:Leucine-rich repeat n=1 Tax=Trema orientale TaxID=63057 RepID=A0A2P5AMQ7_TREOI|nr:Leucine-rich repeat [Trema orientale]